MIAVACVDRDWAIGKEGRLLFHIPEDMARFRRLTSGRAVLMGRRTYEGIGGPLAGRENFVLSRILACAPPGVTVLRSFDEARAFAAGHRRAALIGGAELYAALLDDCERAYLTRVDCDSAGADAFFPNLDETPNWRLVSAGAWQRDCDLKYQFCEYERTPSAAEGAEGV